MLAGGKGTRLRPLTFSYAKQLIPVANKPILFYVLEDIAEAGIKKVGMIVGDTANIIKNEVGDGEHWGLQVEYIEQQQPLGLAHAVKIAEPFLKGEPFVMYLGDNILKGGIKSFVNEYGCNREDINILLTEVKNPEQFGVAVLDRQGSVKELVEKPAHFISNKVLVGIYIFNDKIFEAVNAIRPSWRGELEITDAIQYLLEHGGRVESYIINNWWKDTGKKDDVLEANRLILEDLTEEIKGNIDINSRICGKVNISAGSFIKNSVIEGPVIIDINCKIEDSYIGPYTSIGAGVQIINSELEGSIIMADTTIMDVGTRIASSLIGRNVWVKNRQHKPGIHELLLGDHSLLELYE